jgi:hypothetical protein
MTIIYIKSLKGKDAGWVDTVTRTYHSQRSPEHFMRMYQGFGISESVLSQIKDLVDNVEITYLGQTKVHNYTCKLSQFLKSSKIYNNTEDGAPDPQRFVSVRDMQEK